MRVRPQVEDVGGPGMPHHHVDGAAVVEAPLVQRDPAAQIGQALGEDRGDPTRQGVHLRPLGDETSGEVGPDEAGGPGYEDARVGERSHGAPPSSQRPSSSRASL